MFPKQLKYSVICHIWYDNLPHGSWPVKLTVSLATTTMSYVITPTIYRKFVTFLGIRNNGVYIQFTIHSGWVTSVLGVPYHRAHMPYGPSLTTLLPTIYYQFGPVGQCWSCRHIRNAYLF